MSGHRCPWCGDDPLYVAYHDEEWGVPVRDDRALFEKICLEGQQAGLSWITVLRKRGRYRERFHHFDIDRVARMTDADIDGIVTDAGVIRHRKKLGAIVTNARAARRLREDVFLSDHLWSFVRGETVVNRFERLEDVPAQTEVSKAMSKDLKRRGFVFVGPTTCYAMMQACGMVNDHVVGCFRWRELSGGMVSRRSAM